MVDGVSLTEGDGSKVVKTSDMIECVVKGNRKLSGLAASKVVRKENSDSSVESSVPDETMVKSTEVSNGKKESDSVSEGTKSISVAGCE